MHERSKQAFEQGSGSELIDRARTPAKMRALHSSSALAVNFFDYWVDRDTTPLTRALETGPEPVEVRFEVQYPTGLGGIPPNLDVVLERRDGFVIALESKFTEWMKAKTANLAPFKDKYFPAGTGLWEKAGLPATQRLAESMQAGDIFFRHLDAAQLLKHALGLANNLGTGFRLFYIYYDASGDEALAHEIEIKKFSDRVGEELGFRSVSYQELLLSLEAGQGVDSEYLGYLRGRYF
jgi:hypothetical protein